MEGEKNMLHEFAKGVFDESSGVGDVVENILGALGRLRPGARIVDATVDDGKESILYDLANRHGLGIVATDDPSDESVVCSVGSFLHTPVVVLKDHEKPLDGYIRTYSDSESRSVFVRREFARRVGVTSLQIMLDS